MGEIMAGGLCESSLEPTARTFLNRLDNPDLPPSWRDPANWPPGAKDELGDDKGAAAAVALREKVVKAFRTLRQEIDNFRPDVVLIWSKEQMENFNEDCMPPYCVYAYEDMKIHRKLEPEKEMDLHMHSEAARYLASHLLDQGFDTAYAYKPLHLPIAHTFAGLISYLDWDQKGLPYPVVPFYINSLGHLHLNRKGMGREGPHQNPPAPQPWRMFDVGAATARILRDSPWRVAIIAGSAWSHAAYITEKYSLFPDLDFDRALLQDLKSANYRKWRDLKRDDLIASGNGEFLSWVALAGALDELKLKPWYLDVIETQIFNSTKVTAVFK